MKSYYLERVLFIYEWHLSISACILGIICSLVFYIRLAMQRVKSHASGEQICMVTRGSVKNRFVIYSCQNDMKFSWKIGIFTVKSVWHPSWFEGRFDCYFEVVAVIYREIMNFLICILSWNCWHHRQLLSFTGQLHVMFSSINVKI